jgi:hypothetical protein
MKILKVKFLGYEARLVGHITIKCEMKMKSSISILIGGSHEKI